MTRKIEKILARDLEKTKVGAIFFHWIVPTIIIVYGISGVVSGEIEIKNFNYKGSSAITMGLGIMFLGLGLLGNPALEYRLKRLKIGIWFRGALWILAVALMACSILKNI